MLLALAGGASAYPGISSYPLDAWSNGVGQFNAEYDNHTGSYWLSNSRFFYDSSSAESAGAADAGLNIAIYDWDGAGATKLYGFRGTPFTSTSVPAVTGTGVDSLHPFVMTSKYTTGDCAVALRCLEVTETEQYFNNATSLLVTYDVKNVSTGGGAVQFRMTTGGDVFPGGTEGGTGRYTTTGGRFVGTLNQDRGAAMDLQESTGGGSPPWDQYMEDVPFNVWRKVQDPDGAGLTGTVVAANADKAAAVQWDTYKTTGLASNATAHYEVRWRYRDYDALSVTDPANPPTHTTVNIPIVAMEEDGSFTDLTDVPHGSKLHWRTENGAHNPQTGPGGDWLAQTQTSQGIATISYQGDNPGTDWVEVWLDSNADGVQQANEPYREIAISWFDRVAINYADYDYPRVGFQDFLHLRTVNASNVTEARNFKYKIVDNATSTDRVALSGVLTTASDGDYHDPNPVYNGADGIPILPRTSPGTDVVHVYSDIGGDATYGNQPGEETTYEIAWRNRVIPYPVSQAIDSDDATNSLYVDSYTVDNDYGINDIGWWATNPGAGDPNAHVHDGAPVAPDLYGSTQIPLLPSDVGITPSTGGQRVYHVYVDDNASGSYDAGEPVNTMVVDWVVPLTNRMTFGTYNSDAVIGYPRSLTATVRDDNGALVPNGTHVRYYVTGKNPVSETSAGTTTSGQVSIPMSSAQAGSDNVYAYADLNDNQNADSNEPEAYAYLTWGPSIQISTYDVHVPTQAYAYVEFHKENGDLYTPLVCNYNVTGAHPVGTTTCPIISGGTTSIGWPGSATNVTGTDTLTVNADSLVTNPGNEQGQATEKFLDQLDLSPRTLTKTVGQPVSIYPAIYNASNSGRSFHYVITGANPQSGDVIYGNSIDYTPTNSGTDTVTVSTTAPNVQTVGTVTVNPDALTLTGTGDATQGATKTITATYRDAVTGTPISGATVRWRVTGHDAQYGKYAASTDGSGQVQISWPTNNPGSSYATYDDVTVYADTNDNGVRDTGEPQKVANITLHPALEPNDTYDSLYQGDSKQITVTYRTLGFAPRVGVSTLKYKVVDYSVSYPAGNPAPPTPMPVTDANGQSSVTINGVNAGDDVVKIWDDGNGNDAIDSGEELSNTEIDWNSRVSINPSGNVNRQVTAGPLTVTGHLRTITGASLANTAVKYTIVGLHATSGTQSVTTDASGDFTLPQIPATDGGQDVVTAWLDLDNDGTIDTGESKAVLTLNWTGALSVTPPSQTLFATATHSAISFSGSGISPTTGSLAVSYSGPNVSGRATADVISNWNGSSYPVPAITGGKPGTDYVHAWWDKDNDLVQDAGEPGTTTYVIWKPMITFGDPSGSLEAGNQTTVNALLVDNTGAPRAGTLVHWKTTGVNPQSGTTTTNGSGIAAITYTGTNVGTDTLTVWEETGGDPNGPDSGEAQNARTIFWSAPPVILSATPATDRKFQGNQEIVTLTLTNVPGGNAGKTVYWTVTGTNPTSGNGVTNGAGQVTAQWTGTNDGADTFTAYADVSGAAATKDGYDPNANMTMTWDPLVRITGGASEETTGASHTETVQFVDETGAPLVDTQVIYSISGANPTNGQILARPVSSGAGARILQRTDGSGNASISWTGTNAGTDTLDVWADRNGNGVVDAAEPHAQKTVVFAGAASAGPGGGPPIGTITQVTPGSANDFDGLATPPAPVVAKAVNVEPVSGRVFVKLPGKKNFIELLDAEQIPVGSIVDVRKGTVALTSAQNLQGGVATAQFYAGQFQIAQKKAAKPVTDLLLYGGSFKGCGKSSRKSSAGSSQKKKIRELWGNGKGLFRTKGKYAAAAVRGTKWDVVDYCDGTLVKVAQGLVQVEPVKGKARLVKAPKSLFVPIAGLAKKK